MSNLKGVISAKSKHLSGEAVSREVIIGKEIAEEVIEARDGNECLLDKLNTFVEKIEGKQLSTNDYTNADKSKVDNLPLNTNSELNKKADSDKVYTKSEVDSKLLNKADKSDSLSGYGITDAYTKSEIDNKISNVYEIKGSSTIANLPTNPEVGDVYNITDSGTIIGTEIEVSAGDNIVYTSDGWDKLSATVDLSGYQEKLIFDSTPTEGSTNPVTSGGIKKYIIEATAEDIDNWIGNSDTTSVVGEATAGNAIVGI